jgi:hypothetical protein
VLTVNFLWVVGGAGTLARSKEVPIIFSAVICAHIFDISGRKITIISFQERKKK